MVQILYGSVLLLLPLNDSLETISIYGKALALESTCAYADAVEGIAAKVEPLGTTKDDDYLRTHTISRRLLQLVRDTTGPVYVPATATQEELNAGVPALTWTLQGTAIPRVIEALRKLDSALAWLNAKYDHSAEYRQWKNESESALQMLYGHYSVPTTSW